MAQTDQGIFGSSDNGSHWTHLNAGLADSLAGMLPADSTDLIAGNSLIPVPPLPPNVNTQDAAAELSSLATIVAGIAILGPHIPMDSVLVALDTGSTALKVSQIAAEFAAYTAGLSTTDPLAGRDPSSIVISLDGGKTWTPLTVAMRQVVVFGIAASGPDMYLATTSGVAWFNGETGEFHQGLAGVKTFSAVPFGGLVYAATDSGVFACSDPLFAQWFSVNDGLPTLEIHALVVAGGKRAKDC